ncbi:hypothetical protein FSP39_012867 [Pinctada imbricata]|uniref:Ubiquitin-like domain-containing CTD phosphatase 1 n=1 Tax=Pinctada imbricata TaxID=66713 RepID=A0AA88XZ60_PINIB|nr:hypothetical protein FSP39_012867 [Pinctada imbricata]
MAGEGTQMLEVIIKWSGKEFPVSVSEDSLVKDLKESICKSTGVLPTRQKLLGLKYKGKNAEDDVCLALLKIKPKMKIMMMGTVEEELNKVIEPPTDLPEVVNDLDIDGEIDIDPQNREEYLAKVAKKVADYKIEILNPPRPEKKLLVLDIDYTLFDHRSPAETANELMRPYLHEFLETAYADYDIVIWSATSMKWVETKMKMLGVTTSSSYKICFMIDSLAMIRVDTCSSKYGVIEVKPLGVIWGKFEQWSNKNTIMIDDIRRNFIMNPQSGLRIRSFRNAHVNRHIDTELVKLSKYLKDISTLDDFTMLDHGKWDRYRPKRKHDKDTHKELDVSESKRDSPDNS